MTDGPNLPYFEIDLSSFELNLSEPSVITDKAFFHVSAIKTTQCLCGGLIPNFKTDTLMSNQHTKTEGHIYIFTIADTKDSKPVNVPVYVGLTSRTLSARMHDYDQGGTAKWGESYDCIHKVPLTETLDSDPDYSHQNPADYFKKIRKKLKGKEILGNSQTTNRRVAYLFSRVLANPSGYTGRIWTRPFPQVESLLIEHLKGQKFHLFK